MNANTTFAEIQKLLQGRKAGEALNKCEEVLALHPRNTVFRALQVFCFLALGRKAEAHYAYAQAEAGDPLFSHCYEYRDSRIRSGDLSLASRLRDQLHQYLRLRNHRNILVSFPKSGRTWLRVLLGEYLLGGEEGNPLEIASLSRQKMGPEGVAEAPDHDNTPQLKPPWVIEGDKRAYLNNRVVFLVRDPRDVVVSVYFQFSKRGDSTRRNATANRSIDEFVWGDIGCLPSIVRFYNQWARHRSLPEDFYLLRYEDFHDDPGQAFSDLLSFLGWPQPDSEEKARILRASSFESMRDAEKSQRYEGVALAPGQPEDPESYKTRRGKAGGYVDYLQPSTIADMNRYLADFLDPYFTSYLPRR